MNMQGVVIWYCRQAFRAIIWCEDSKELGVANDATAWRNPMLDVQVGDVVAFQPVRRGSDRLCRDLRVVQSGTARSLPLAVVAKAQTRPNRGNPLLHLCSSRD